MLQSAFQLFFALFDHFIGSGQQRYVFEHKRLRRKTRVIASSSGLRPRVIEVALNDVFVILVDQQFAALILNLSEGLNRLGA